MRPRLNRVAAALFASLVAVWNVRLYAPAEPDVTPHLRLLQDALRSGAAERMQEQFPEGYLFTHATYGLAWLNVGRDQPERRAEACAHARAALLAIDSADGRRPFEPSLDPPYGVFYAGWCARLHGGLLALTAPPDRRPDDVAEFEARCDALAAAFEAADSPFLASYPAQAWPVDSIVAVAALRLHGQLLPARFEPLIESWLRAADIGLDPATGLFAHACDPVSGQPQGPARGSSQTLLLPFLFELEGNLAAVHYQRFRRHFVAAPAGLPGVREYRRGVRATGDVDSGPLIFGLSPSASVVAPAAARLAGDGSLLRALTGSQEALLWPVRRRGGRDYLLGRLPVVDGFAAWARSAGPAPDAGAALDPGFTPLWRLPAHLTSLLLLLALARAALRPARPARPARPHTDSTQEP